MWHDEWDDQLRSNWKVPGALSTRQLAEKLGTTKGTVIRRARKIGLASDDVRRRPASVPSLFRVRADSLVPGEIAPVLPSVKPVTPAKRQQVLKFSPPGPTSYHRECQWMDGNGADAPRCCQRTIVGFSWCQEHMDRVFVRREQKQRSAA